VALANLVAGVHSRAPSPDVVVAGGVILKQRRLFDAFERRLAPCCLPHGCTT